MFHKIFKKIIKASPVKISREDLVENFKANLTELESKKVEVERLLLNGPNIVSDHCFDLRLVVVLATETVIAEIDSRLETAIAEIQQKRDAILKEINDYEAKTVALSQVEGNKRNEFEESVKSLTDFLKEWKDYSERVEIDKKEVAKRNDIAVEMIKKAEKDQTKLINCF